MPIDAEADLLDREEMELTESGRTEKAIATGRTLGRGLVGGLISTVVMTSFRMPIAHSLPPTSAFWARFVGDGEDSDYPLQGLVLHLLYGMAGGGLFALLFEQRVTESGHMDEAYGTLLGTVYGLLLSEFGIHVVLKRVLRMELQSDERFVFHLSHLIYGVTLGAWSGSRAKHRRDEHAEGW
ncbi:hypothetical protein [Haladaptatus caseinilyticus]|uniref:hypothetical protein n=1 Tax=Haladaptatus caseinilyticus TaxID=2993314 RepID=UPI00224B9E4B|nr:hypothetical protein [Haladaptatus caseinilyticus]